MARQMSTNSRTIVPNYSLNPKIMFVGKHTSRIVSVYCEKSTFFSITGWIDTLLQQNDDGFDDGLSNSIRDYTNVAILELH